MEQLTFDIDVPTTKVWVAVYGEYGARWDQENSFAEVYFGEYHDIKWVEDIDGNVIWGDRPDKHNWPPRDAWFDSNYPERPLIVGHKDLWPMQVAIETGDIDEVARVFDSWLNRP